MGQKNGMKYFPESLKHTGLSPDATVDDVSQEFIDKIWLESKEAFFNKKINTDELVSVANYLWACFILQSKPALSSKYSYEILDVAELLIHLDDVKTLKNSTNKADQERYKNAAAELGIGIIMLKRSYQYSKGLWKV